MTPHLVRWQNDHGPRGLTVVYADDGRRDALAAMQARIRDEGWTFPVFHDATGAAMTTYAIQAYPTAYILDRTGRVVWEGIPVFDPAATERAIVAALGGG
jgi:hypothetical protein